MAAGYEKAYDSRSVFRAENSESHRQLTEYTGLDVEMGIEEHYYDALEVIDAMLKHIFKGISRLPRSCMLRSTCLV